MQAFNTTLQIVQNSSTLFNRCFCFFFPKSLQSIHKQLCTTLTSFNKTLQRCTQFYKQQLYKQTLQDFTKLYNTLHNNTTLYKHSTKFHKLYDNLRNNYITFFFDKNFTTTLQHFTQAHNNFTTTLQNFTTHCTTLQNSTQHSLQHFTTLYNSLQHCTQLCV